MSTAWELVFRRSRIRAPPIATETKTVKERPAWNSTLAAVWLEVMQAPLNDVFIIPT